MSLCIFLKDLVSFLTLCCQRKIINFDLNITCRVVVETLIIINFPYKVILSYHLFESFMVHLKPEIVKKLLNTFILTQTMMAIKKTVYRHKNK